MRFFEVSLALGALLSLGANASPIDVDLVERQNTFFAITGPTGTSAGVAPRLEVRDLANNADQWNLFVLAMSRFQSKAQDGKLSWYQVAGIHGRPYVNWDGVGPYQSSPWWPGYCPHSSNLFGSWHRPYILLFEQLLIQYANEVINEIPAGATKTRYQTAVKTLRFPYWDWAKKTTGGIMPTTATQAQISVTFPQNGTTASIPNPLYSYRQKVLPNRDFDSNYANQQQTTRLADAEARLNAAYTSRRNNLLTLFSLNQKFNNFTTDANGNTSPNVEAIHNGIHVDVGGWMQQIAYSAFDPIFAMHHCNVDRVVAIWQKLYPNSWVESAAQGAGTRTMAPSSIQGPDSPLTPFHSNTGGSFWTSNTVRDINTLGYTYPDLQNIASNQVLISNLNRLYGNSATNTALKASVNGNSPQTTYDYLAQITLDKTALGGQSYAIEFSLEGAYIGSYAALALPTPPGAPGQSGPITSSGTMMFTDALAQKGVDTSDQDATIDYLSKNLQWKVVQNGATVNNVKNLNVTVCSLEVKPAKATNQFPTWVSPPEAIANSTSS
ncbi:putative tyrosinase protein [Neofusicoccum parvum UCRNP2]|uniref:tyrosinase n=1 Tax=Botryosphaeria parva (strain UCR-NP2) TaxID=1287680 RepID=R1GGH2_BOTPV|nr:putative tyrosinase protein [Neofusicoccum parvum UCRNP2]